MSGFVLSLWYIVSQRTCSWLLPSWTQSLLPCDFAAPGLSSWTGDWCWQKDIACSKEHAFSKLRLHSFVATDKDSLLVSAVVKLLNSLLSTRVQNPLLARSLQRPFGMDSSVHALRYLMCFLSLHWSPGMFQQPDLASASSLFHQIIYNIYQPWCFPLIIFFFYPVNFYTSAVFGTGCEL